MDSLQATDIVVLTAVLLISVGFGVFFAVRDKGKRSIEDYYFGGRKLSPIPVAASLAVSFVSAIAIIGLPVEVYLYGAVFVWNTLAQLIATVVAILWYVPLYHRLKLSSVYEFLELRFNRAIRLIASLSSWINTFLYLGLVTYLPSLALSATTPLSLHVAIAITSIAGTFYTTIGGMKAVVWTDLLQCLIMIVGMLSIFIQTVLSVGGLDELTEAAYRGERLNFFKFELDPRARSTFWTLSVGLAFNTCFMMGCDQIYIQRYLSCKTVKDARIALLLAMIPGFMFTALCVGNGLAMYAFYENCDPYVQGHLEKIDQMIPHLVVKIFQGIPGMAGLFVAATYCGTLSTVSSGINAMSALVLHDFIKPFWPNIVQRNAFAIATGLSMVFGILVMILAYVVSLSSVNIVQIFVSISGWIAGPMIGIFTMGIFMPWINSKGALYGFVIGWIAVGWIGISAMFSSERFSPEPMQGKLPTSTSNCDSRNGSYFTRMIANTTINQTQTTEISIIGTK